MRHLVRTIHSNPLQKQGFTLIELLIVIAIILILIAIALPNFLEAQIRARVAKAKGNMRTLSAALESYRLDWGIYPTDHEPDSIAQWHGLYQLTSPHPYLKELPEDPFSTRSGILDPSTQEVGWELASTCSRPQIARFYATQNNSKVIAFALASQGPDTGSGTGGGSAGGDDFYGNLDWPFLGRSLTCPSLQGWRNYDPTNGTKSPGDIVLVGGEHRSGRYCIDNWYLVVGKYPPHIP